MCKPKNSIKDAILICLCNHVRLKTPLAMIRLAGPALSIQACFLWLPGLCVCNATCIFPVGNDKSNFECHSCLLCLLDWLPGQNMVRFCRRKTWMRGDRVPLKADKRTALEKGRGRGKGEGPTLGFNIFFSFRLKRTGTMRNVRIAHFSCLKETWRRQYFSCFLHRVSGGSGAGGR